MKVGIRVWIHFGIASVEEVRHHPVVQEGVECVEDDPPVLERLIDAGDAVRRLAHQIGDESLALPHRQIAHEGIGGPIMDPVVAPAGEVGAGIVGEAAKLAIGPTIIPSDVLRVGGEALVHPCRFLRTAGGLLEQIVTVVHDEVREFVSRERPGVLGLGSHHLGVEVDHLPPVGIALPGRRRDVEGREVAVDTDVGEIVEKYGDPGLVVDARARLCPQDLGQSRVYGRIELRAQPLYRDRSDELAVLRVDHTALAHVRDRRLDLQVAPPVPVLDPEGVDLADRRVGRGNDLGRSCDCGRGGRRSHGGRRSRGGL